MNSSFHEKQKYGFLYDIFADWLNETDSSPRDCPGVVSVAPGFMPLKNAARRFAVAFGPS